MHGIFFIPELLNEIFSYSSKHTNTIAARVCRLWFTHSISFIWDTASLNDALKVLSPFSDDVDKSDVGFQQPLSSHSWSRFSLYSTNICQLQASSIPCAAIRQALLWKPCVDPFFPKLTSLHWAGPSKDIEYLLPLLTPTLQILRVDSHPITSVNPIEVLSNIIPFRLPSLRALELNFDPPADNANHSHAVTSQSLVKLLSPLSELTMVSLPIDCMTGELFTILSRLPRLEDLSLLHSCALDHWEFPQLHVEHLPERKIVDEKSGGYLPFRSLCKLDVSDPASEQGRSFMIAQMIGHGVQFLKLVELTCYFVTNQSIIIFMESVHRICPSVQKISISAEEVLPWQAIQPLIQCPALVELKSSTINMALEDIVTIATNRSSWTAINLPSLTPLSYQALVVFAQNCPDLFELGLILDSNLEFPFTTDIEFSSLKFLNIGDSELSTINMMEVATFLSSICGKPPKIRDLEEEDMTSTWMVVEEIIILQLRNRKLEDEIARLRISIDDSSGKA